MNVSTIPGSNWVPAHARSSRMASRFESAL